MQVSTGAVIVVVIVLLFIMSAIAYSMRARWVRQSFVSFLLRYIAISGILFLIEYAFLELLPPVHAALRSFTAEVVGQILALTGAHPEVSGSMIRLTNPPLAFDVTAACLGGILYWVYIGLVFAQFGITPRQRLLGLVAGLSTLAVFNIYRITLSINMEARTGVYIHDYFYVFNMLFVLFIWAGWLRTLNLKGQDLATQKPQ